MKMAFSFLAAAHAAAAVLMMMANHHAAIVQGYSLLPMNNDNPRNKNNRIRGNNKEMKGQQQNCKSYGDYDRPPFLQIMISSKRRRDKPNLAIDRRGWIVAAAATATATITTITAAAKVAAAASPASAAAFIIADASNNGNNNNNNNNSNPPPPTPTPTPPLFSQALERAASTLRTLLDHWEDATIDCTYADVPRELLETKNKAQLLEKATQSALFDKSGSTIISCKTVNNKVRDYIGVTNIGPLAKAEINKNLQLAFEYVMDNNNMDDTALVDAFVQAKENLQVALTNADSLSYEARNDFTSMNNFDPANKDSVLADTGSNLAQARNEIQLSLQYLNQIISIVTKTTTTTTAAAAAAL